MTYQEAMEYVEGLKKYGSVPGLENIANLCEKLGNPQKELSFVHIAGTNGKGSVLAFVSEILKEAGYRVGRYLSPTLFDYRERLQIGQRPVSQKKLCGLMELMKEKCEELVGEGKPHPTAFEVETAMAFYYFREQGCALVVLEAGLGGLLDATNIVQNTLVEIFTSISLDHMGVLGNTPEAIARNKAGIMKPGSAAVALKGGETVMEVLKQRAEELRIPLRLVDPDEAENVKSSLTGQSFDWGSYKKLKITMAGRYQLENAMLSIAAVEALSQKGFPVKEKAIYAGLQKTLWQGRFQVLSKAPCFIADGAHNRDGAERLAQSIRFYFTNRRIIYIIGILRDKEQDEILKRTCPLAAQILTVPTKGERGLSSYELACMAEKYHPNVTAADSVEEAIELAYLSADKDTVVIAFGSLSYLGSLIKTVENVSDKKNRRSMGRDSHGKQRES